MVGRTIHLARLIDRVYVYIVKGELVAQYLKYQSIDIEHLEAGVYMLRLKEGGSVFSGTVVRR